MAHLPSPNRKPSARGSAPSLNLDLSRLTASPALDWMRDGLRYAMACYEAAGDTAAVTACLGAIDTLARLASQRQGRRPR